MFIATHGHKDHIGGLHSLNEIEGSIHHKDWGLLPNYLKNKLSPNLPDNGLINDNLECVLLGHHTEGSVAIYDHRSRVLFCGDHICFFGEPLPDMNIVDEGQLTRDQLKMSISELSQSDEMREKHNFDLFMEGLRKLKRFDAEYLCTGHGAVLKGNISGFISDLLEIE